MARDKPQMTEAGMDIGQGKNITNLLQDCGSINMKNLSWNLKPHKQITTYSSRVSPFAEFILFLEFGRFIDNFCSIVLYFC